MGRRIGTKAKRPADSLADAPALVPAAAAAKAAEPRDDVLSAMTAAVADGNPASTAEALRVLRLAYPHHPLALRLAAIAIAMKRPPATGEPAIADADLCASTAH